MEHMKLKMNACAHLHNYLMAKESPNKDIPGEVDISEEASRLRAEEKDFPRTVTVDMESDLPNANAPHLKATETAMEWRKRLAEGIFENYDKSKKERERGRQQATDLQYMRTCQPPQNYFASRNYVSGR